MNTLKHKYLCDKGRSNIVKKKICKDQKSFLENWPKHLI